MQHLFNSFEMTYEADNLVMINNSRLQTWCQVILNLCFSLKLIRLKNLII